MRKVLKSRIFICIFTALVVGTVSVSAVTYFPSNQVTYDNTVSGLKSTQVQDAIDELYNTCSLATKSGNYIYYTTSSYSYRGGYDDPPVPSGGQVVRCNYDGKNCTTLIVSSGYSVVDGVAVTKDYVYYSVTSYSYRGGYDELPTKSAVSVNRCNINGKNCNALIGYGGQYEISGLAVTDDSLFYTMTSFDTVQFKGSVEVPVGGNTYKCNLNGSNCVTVGGLSGYSGVTDVTVG